MNLVDACLLATAIFFALYGVACSVETGVALSFLLGNQAKSRRYFTPLWEVTNVFLVFGITALVMLFNNALSLLSSALLSTILVGLVTLIIRACIVLAIFYWRPESVTRGLAWSFLAACYAIPLSFAAAGAYLFTGQLFWHSFTGWLVMTAAFLGITSLGLLTMNNDRRPSSLASNELVFASWMLVLGSALPVSAKIALPQLQKTPMLLLSFLSIVGLVMALVGLTSQSSKLKLWRLGAVIAFVAPILLAWASRPYLVAGKITLADGFGAAAYAKAFLVGTAIILPLVLLGFWLFWRLLRSPDLD